MKGIELWDKAKAYIPGGSQLFSKRAELFLPGGWPCYYTRAKGCEVWDLEGQCYIDMSYMGIGSCVLGYADDDVNEAVLSVIQTGNITTLNAPEEIKLAEILCQLHPWASMVRYARTGGEAMALAVRIARAHTGKDTVLFCGYHGWHDWYLAANLADDRSLDGHLLPGLNPAGVPRGLKGTALPFAYNDTEAFLELMSTQAEKIGAVVMEPIRSHEPKPGFLEAIRYGTSELQIPLIFDEITAGFRLSNGGAHLALRTEPDIAVFAKGMSNGFPMAAVLGRREVMEAAQDTFISSTYWTDRIGPAAAIATITKFRKCNVATHLITSGQRVKEGWAEIAARHGVQIEIGGIDPLAHFSFKNDPLVMKTLFTQLMLEQGFLATNAYYASHAHHADQIDLYLQAADRAFARLAEASEHGRAESCLKGPVCHSGFTRLT